MKIGMAMILHNCTQGSDEWHELRLGKPTASAIKRILTSKKLELSASADKYADELVAELLTGESADGSTSQFMERGKDLEVEAVKWFEWTKNIDTVQVGFISDDAERYGCSPDRLIGDDGGLEIKCPSATVHVSYITKPKTLIDEYRLQVQFTLWVTKRKYWYLMSFNPSMKEAIVRIEPDPEVFEALDKAMPEFLKLVDEKRDKIHAMMRGE